MIEQLFSEAVLVGILASGIRLATPYLYAAMGETFSQRSGVLNLGVEGQMLLGAFAAFYVSFTTGNLFFGLLAAILTGLIMGLAMAFVSVNLQAEQGISGIGFYLFGLGFSDLLFQKLLGTVETVSGFRPVQIPFLSDIPILGPIFSYIGVHPVHFAIIMSVNLTVGLATPPMGLVLFVASSVSGERVETISKAILPFLAVEVVVIFLITFFPAISLTVPRLAGFIQ